MRLDNVAAVQERHGTVGPDPDLVARVLGQDGQTGNVQAKLAGLAELALKTERCPVSLCRTKMRIIPIMVTDHLPRHVPTDRSLSLPTDVAKFAIDKRT